LAHSVLPLSRNNDFKNSYGRSLAQDTSPIEDTGLSTPPRSRGGSSIASPLPTFSSPPRALTETYERIDQEEDLAATEGEISDPEDNDLNKENEPKLNGYKSTKQRPHDASRHVPRSGGSTPTNRLPLDKKPRRADEDLTTASVLSDPTGMSFVRDLSDRNLQKALTPLVLESAKIEKTLEQAWLSRKPIAFSKAGRIANDNIDVPDPVALSPNLPPLRLIPFSKAGRIKLASDLVTRPQHQRTFSDVTLQTVHNHRSQEHSARNDNWHGEDLPRNVMPHNPRLQRQNFFPQNHGFPARKSSGDNEPHLADGHQNDFQETKSVAPLISSSQRPQPNELRRNGFRRSLELHKPLKPAPSYEALAPEGDLTLESDQQSQATSDIDWMQVAADQPIKTIEPEFANQSPNQLSDTQEILTSPEKSRRLDMDFTGQSIQVSESPPVRSKAIAKDYHRDREIEGIAKQAVTTSRLSQLRARESHERIRATSKSPVSEVSDLGLHQSRSRRSSSLTGEGILDTPIVIYKTSSAGSTGKHSSTPVVRPSPDRSRSHEVLQRLARGSSSTPRSSTPTDKTVNDDVVNAGREHEDVVLDETLEAGQMLIERPELYSEGMSKTVQQTPKVVGAWTDTILPDTIKTTKRNGQTTRYAQTPHVNAGGWVDTPGPNGQSAKLEPVLEVTQEVPEELMKGIVKEKVGAHDVNNTEVAAEATSDSRPVVINSTVTGESLAQKVLSEAKDKIKVREQTSTQLALQGTEPSSRDDTLTLGNATIQSLENILEMDHTDITILSRLGDDPLSQTEEEILDRLGSRLDRLRRHIHDAKKGISNIEHEMAEQQHQQQQSQQSQQSQQPQQSQQSSQLQTSIEIKPQQHTTTPTTETLFPTTTILNIKLPLPLLFHPPPNKPTTKTTNTTPPTVKYLLSHLPHPTPLGWLILLLTTWYILETTLSTLYSHPPYASHYTFPIQPEPEFPYVLPTMLWRWSRLTYLWAPVWAFLGGVVRMLGIWVGWGDGFVDDGLGVRGGVEKAVETVKMVASAGATAVSEGVDMMMNDEFL